MGGQHKMGSTYKESIQQPPPAYRVTGNGNPNMNGDYNQAGIANGQPYYSRTTGTYFLWWNDIDAWWVINNLINNNGHPHFHGDSGDILGVYSSHQGATGTATVAAGT
jgi:hypothetical protein